MEDLVFEKKCSKCGEVKPVAQFGIRRSKVKRIERRDSWCKACYAVNTAEYVSRDPAETKRRRADYWRNRTDETKKRQIALRQKRYRKEHARLKHQQRKRECLERYGGAFCKCCGETEILMLSLDHLDGNGAAHRKAMTGTRSMQTYDWAKRHGYPPIFQVLCMNCNWARHWNDGVCPHEVARLRLVVA